MVAAGRPAPRALRAPDRRPRVVLLDVLGTMLQVNGLRSRFVDVGRPEHECDLFFARALRSGIALTLAGPTRPFVLHAREALRSTTGHELSEEALDHVLDGLHRLPPHADVEVALVALARAKIPVYAFGYGSARGVAAALDRTELRTYLRGIVSTDEVGLFRPAAQAYLSVCQAVHTEPARTAMVSGHSWDVHGALRTGLLGALVTRLEGGVPATIDPPHVHATRLDEVVERLVELPA
ncbi:HAD family hydrolase [Pseudonocardia hispaniensis]|uniref:HAD family hydrolase n=1 Tax=Pseudonocardia hispaniensis TaxID=904933 RepID=A0ABW1J0F0_9PSEU